MPVAPRRPADLRGRFFRGSDAVATGRLSPAELRSSAWRRLFRDVYVCADVPVTHELRVVAAAGLVVPGSVVTGRSAAVLWGLPAAERDDDVELTVPSGSNVCRVRGITVRRRAFDPALVTVRHGTRVTTAEATAVDLARTGTLEEAVIMIDRFVEARAADLDPVRAGSRPRSGARGGSGVIRSGLPAGADSGRSRRRSGGLTAGDPPPAAPAPVAAASLQGPAAS